MAAKLRPDLERARGARRARREAARRARRARAGRRSRAGREGARMSDLLALGISHKTAPIELRERLALTEGRAAGVLNELRSHAQVSEAAAISTCNRTEIYLFVSDPVEAENAGARRALPARPGSVPPSWSAPLLLPRDRGRSPPVPGHRRARLDDRRRGRDPGPGQARLRARPRRGRHRRDPQPALPRRPRRRQAGSRRDQDRGGRMSASPRSPSSWRRARSGI